MNTSNSATTLFSIAMALLILAAVTVVPDNLNGSRQLQAEYTGFQQLFSIANTPDDGLNDATLALPTVGGSSK